MCVGQLLYRRGSYWWKRVNCCEVVSTEADDSFARGSYVGTRGGRSYTYDLLVNRSTILGRGRRFHIGLFSTVEINV